jgi:hypothetical protein
MHLMAAGRAGEITADAVRLEVRKYRDTGPCDCLKLRLWSVEEQLRAARKAWRASTTDGNAQRVTALTARRDLLRGMA